MVKFDKKDIPALDFIIGECLKNDSKIVIANDLIENGYLTHIKEYSSRLYLDEQNEFERLMFIIRQYNCAKTRFVSENEANLVSNVSKNLKTLHFKSQGGFKKAYKKLQKPINWYKIIAIIISVIFGSLNFYQKKINNSLKTENYYLKTKLDSLKENNKNLNKEEKLSNTLINQKPK